MLKKIINPWRNNPQYHCFGCCPDNPIGLHMEFYEDGDYIMSTWYPNTHYQGWVNTMHGGILSTLIDEVCGWVVTRKLQTSGYTVQLNVKFRKAVPTTEPELAIPAIGLLTFLCCAVTTKLLSLIPGSKYVIG
jgi:hypothetical protein